MTPTVEMPLVGFRRWWIRGLQLTGNSFQYVFWETGETVARCLARGRLTPCGAAGRPVPNPDCWCGLHGYVGVPRDWEFWADRERYGPCAPSMSRMLGSFQPCAVGAALFYGRYQVGPNVIRAERAAVLALIDTSQEACDVAGSYGVPVVRDVAALEAFASEHGQSAAGLFEDREKANLAQVSARMRRRDEGSRR